MLGGCTYRDAITLFIEELMEEGEHKAKNIIFL